jgi:three-Cys-motif partner protein
MTRFNERIVYIDGFAGPGEYKDGEPGSPLIAIDAFLKHSYAPMREKGVLFFFIEQNPARCKYLEQLLAQRWQGQKLPPKAKYEVYQGNFDETMTDLLTELEQRQQRLAPTFAFIDPFGYSHTPMQTITRLMSHPKSEVLITFMYEELNRFITFDYQNKARQYDALFGTPEWREIEGTISNSVPRSLSQERKNFIHNLYSEQLRNVGGAKYVRSFCMRNKKNITDYFLFFGTKSIAGIKAMKQAMWKVDSTGTYEFSDFTNPDQLLLFSQPDYTILQRMLSKHFHGKTVSIEEIEEYVIAETPFYKFRMEALKPMEIASPPLIQVQSTNPKRVRGTFAEGKTSVRFL